MDILSYIFQVQTWTDVLYVVLDLSIVYFVIYRILLLIKGTRAVQMMIGLVFILLFYVVSQQGYLDLSTTRWFIEKFIANFIIIVVIIFQQDIRRALAEVGRTSFVPGTRAYEETQVIEEVIKASVMLSQRKLGALIAIEREADLTPFTEEGIQLGGVVSKDLLFSLFLPEHQNPLHDGAVIIQQSRVAAAGCFLPLTNNPKVEKTLGTRHRAAIGLSEDTDAAVVIVSEETGTISIAWQGELYRELDANEMRDILQKIYGPEHFASRRPRFLEEFQDRRTTTPSPADLREATIDRGGPPEADSGDGDQQSQSTGSTSPPGSE